MAIRRLAKRLGTDEVVARKVKRVEKMLCVKGNRTLLGRVVPDRASSRARMTQAALAVVILRLPSLARPSAIDCVSCWVFDSSGPSRYCAREKRALILSSVASCRSEARKCK
jgi:hypothetical protein